MARHRLTDVGCPSQLLSLTAGTDQSTATDHVGIPSLAQHRFADVKCSTQLPAVTAGTDQSIVGDLWAPELGTASPLRRHCSTQLLALTACTDQGTVGDHVGLQSSAPQLRADIECPTQLLALTASTDQSTVGDRVGLQSSASHFTHTSKARRSSWPLPQALIKAL